MGRRKGPALTRQDVLDAGLDVVETQGASALGTAAVAGVLGIRPPSIYHHFAGNEALAYAVAVEGWRRLVASLPAPGPDLTLRALAHAYRQFALDHPALYRLMTSTPFDPADPALLAVWARAAQALAALDLEPREALHALRGLRAALHGFVHLELAGQVRLGVPADESFEWLVDLVLRGIEQE